MASLSMNPSDILSLLTQSGCDDVTHALDLTRTDQYPFDGGFFNDVYRGMLLGGVKIVIKSHRLFSEGADEMRRQALQWMMKSIYVGSKMNHPNVLEVYGVALFRGQISAVLAWMKNGTLNNYLRRYPDADRLQLCVQVSRGLQYLHENGMVHGDLKGPSVMINEAGIARLCSFGNAVFENPPSWMPKEFNQPSIAIRWAAPELLMGGSCTKMTDIYALGKVMLEIVTAEPPFNGKSDVVVIHTVFKGGQMERPKELDALGKRNADKLWSIMSCCCSYDPDHRPDIFQVVHELEELLSSPTPRSITISRRTVGSEIISHLVAHGVADVTRELDLDNCGTYPIAGGGFGDIYLGRVFRAGKVAIKCPRLFYRQDTLAGEAARNIAREVYTWSKLQHPNILELVGLATFRGQLSIVAPWQENGTLPNYLKKHPKSDRFQLCVQISSGLAYLHEANIVHGDVKGENILVSELGVAKLTDFGNTLLKKYTIEFTGRGDATPLSMRWSAPELLEGSTQTKEADVYALGMTFLQIVTGEVPFCDRMTDVAVMRAIIAGTTPARPEKMDEMEGNKADVLWETITQCWNHEAAHRPNASGIEHKLSSV